MKRRGGGSLTLNDFLPDYCRKKQRKTKPKQSEARLKAALMALTKRTSSNG